MQGTNSATKCSSYPRNAPPPPSPFLGTTFSVTRGKEEEEEKCPKNREGHLPLCRSFWATKLDTHAGNTWGRLQRRYASTEFPRKKLCSVQNIVLIFFDNVLLNLLCIKPIGTLILCIQRPLAQYPARKSEQEACPLLEGGPLEKS